jgi:hypothetical protein
MVLDNSLGIKNPYLEALLNVIVVEQARRKLGNNKNLLQGGGTPKGDWIERDPV